MIAFEFNMFQKKLKNSYLTNISQQIFIDFNLLVAKDSIMSWCFCIGFIDFMITGKSLLDYTNLNFSNEYEK